MKQYLAIAAFAGLCLASSGYAAQTCTADSASAITAAGTYPTTGTTTTCGGQSGLSDFCSNGSETLNGAGAYVYSFTLGSPNSFTISATSAAFTPWIGFVASTCSDVPACIVDKTIAAAGTATSNTLSGLAAGTYYMIIGDVSTDTPGCGAFTVAVVGQLPVKLQNFSIN